MYKKATFLITKINIPRHISSGNAIVGIRIRRCGISHWNGPSVNPENCQLRNYCLVLTSNHRIACYESIDAF